MPVVPERLEASGFSFTHPTVEDAVAAAAQRVVLITAGLPRVLKDTEGK